MDLLRDVYNAFMGTNFFYQTFLKSELEERLRKNSRYSLRAFANSFSIDPGDLSRILNGTKVLTPDLSKKILKQLNLSPQETQEFIFSMAQAYEEKGIKRRKSQIKEMLKSSKNSYHKKDLSAEAFRVISDWQHYALLQLIESENFVNDVKWISKQLDISEMETKLALERLFSLDLIKEESGSVVRTFSVINTGDRTITTDAHRKRIKQITDKSLYALENCEIGLRSHTTLTLSIDPDQIPLAKVMIEEFMDKLENALQTRKKKVYELQINLFPLQKG